MTSSCNGTLFVVTGPSGAGKSTVISKYLTENKDVFFSVSATTRSQRIHEQNGVDYYFIKRSEFEKMLSEDKFLEHAEYVGNLYGTPSEPVFDAINKGHDVILQIEVTGALSVRKKCPDAVLIFIVPPSFSALELRLKGRGTEPDEIIRKRLEKAKTEYKAADLFDFIVVNSDVENGANELKTIIDAEKLKTKKRRNFIEV
ncbi:MAG: guanylate kinase [Clostridiales bacterium]|nr:guanylate kinase [Clostridiales bacterium]